MNKLYAQLSAVDTNGISRWVCVDEFVGEYAPLKLGNGGSWCRFDGTFGKKYKLAIIKENGTMRFSWKTTDNEQTEIINEIEEHKKNNKIIIIKSKGNKNKYFKTYGLQNKNENRPISQKIRDYYKNKNCVNCSSYHDTVIDHKNGLYNDKRVLDIKTQTIDDFQVLCNHCNLMKRQVIIDMKKTKKRLSGLDINTVKFLNISYIYGNEDYDENDPDWGKGTYWHDPDAFRKIAIEMKNITTKINSIKIDE